jgi:hypothetical protein
MVEGLKKDPAGRRAAGVFWAWPDVTKENLGEVIFLSPYLPEYVPFAKKAVEVAIGMGSIDSSSR